MIIHPSPQCVQLQKLNWVRLCYITTNMSKLSPCVGHKPAMFVFITNHCEFHGPEVWMGFCSVLWPWWIIIKSWSQMYTQSVAYKWCRLQKIVRTFIIQNANSWAEWMEWLKRLKHLWREKLCTLQIEDLSSELQKWKTGINSVKDSWTFSRNIKLWLQRGIVIGFGLSWYYR